VNNSIKVITLLSLAFWTFAEILFAADPIETLNNSSSYTLPLISIEAIQPHQTSETILNKEMLDSLPTANTNLTDYLLTIPGIQFSDDYNLSKTGGEITPTLISISGGRPEDNLFTLDGVSISSQLDPLYTNASSHTDIPGNPLTQYIMGASLEQLKVMRYDIPAKYDGFNGGVIASELRKPSEELSGKVSLRMTRSCWGEFHISDEDEEDFYNSENEDNQPNFDKYQLNTSLSGPISDKVNVIMSYSRLDSEIPLSLLGEQKNQSRLNENLFIKTQITPRSDTEINLIASYSPYSGDYFLEDTKNSDYSIIGGGYLVSTNLHRELNFGHVNASLSYQHSDNSRSASNTWYSWKITDSTDWGDIIDSSSSREGGYGDLDTTQTDIEAKLEYATDNITLGWSDHQLTNGLQISRTEATSERDEDTILYVSTNSSVDASVTCDAGDEACIDGEQYAKYQTVYSQYSAKTEFNHYSYYLDDSITIGRLKLRPGLRFSYESLQKNLNIAPRFAMETALFSDNWPHLHAGWNRYFRDNLLSMYLYEQRPATTYYSRSLDADGTPGEWEYTRSSVNKNRVSDLDTPSVDEWSLGLSQKVLGGHLSVDYVNRHYEKQIITVWTEESDDITYKKWTNDGEKKYEELSLQWERTWENVYLNINATWSDSTSNSSSYASTYYEDEVDYVWYNGELMSRANLPADNYARPIKASMTLSTKLAAGFSATGTATFKDRYKKLTDTGNEEDGYPVYDVVSIPSAFTIDMQLAWEKRLWNTQHLILTCDILNVLNKKIHDGSDDDNYLLGRQYWLGITYKF
jgi:hypothetical protein